LWKESVKLSERGARRGEGEAAEGARAARLLAFDLRGA